MRMCTRTTVAAVLVTLAAASGCGSDDSSADDPTGGGGTSTTSPDPSTTTVPIEPAGTYGERVTQVIPFDWTALNAASPPAPLYVAYGSEALWVSHHRTHTVSRIDPATGEVIATIAIDPTPGSTATAEPTFADGLGGGRLVATDDAVWVLDANQFAWRIDPETNAIVQRVEQPGVWAEDGIALADGVLWSLAGSLESPHELAAWYSVDSADSSLGRVDAPDELGDMEAPERTLNASGIVASEDGVWAGTLLGVLRLDPTTNTLADQEPIDLDGAPIGMSGGLVWGAGPNEVWAIDPETDEVVESFEKPDDVDSLRPWAATVADGMLWIVAGLADRFGSYPESRQQLVGVDLETGEIETFDLMNAEFGYNMGLAVADGAVWVTDFARGNLLRVDVADN
jgi:hypothetical protein